MPKILLVEDDKFISTIHKHKLAENQDWQIITAEDGDEAIAKITSEQPDLILLDMMIPKKNGFEVLAEIKANPSLSAIPVIVTSGLEKDDDVKKGLELGAVDYLPKSSNTVDHIVNKVAQHLPQSTAVAPSAPAPAAPIKTCSSCQQTLDPSAKFCPNCGQPAA